VGSDGEGGLRMRGCVSRRIFRHADVNWSTKVVVIKYQAHLKEALVNVLKSSYYSNVGASLHHWTARPAYGGVNPSCLRRMHRCHYRSYALAVIIGGNQP
jgi:hypothetical protein